MRASADSTQLTRRSEVEQRDDNTPRGAISHCPHLGIVDDPATTFAFATPANHCFSNQKPDTIEIHHQQSYCLTNRYTACPLYQQALSAAAGSTPVQEEQALFVALSRLRKSLAAPIAGMTLPRSRTLMSALVGLLLVALLYIGLDRLDLLSSLGGRGNDDSTQQPVAEAPASGQPLVILDDPATETPSPTAISATPTAFHTATPTAATITALEETAPSPTTEIPTPTHTAIASATPTQATSESESPSPTATTTMPAVTATRCGPPSGWVTYIVQRGENLYRIGLRYNLGVSAMMEANCLSTASVYAGQTLYVPFRTPINNPSPTPIVPAPSDDPPPPPEPTATNEPPSPPPEDTPPPPPPPTETPPPPPTATPPPAATPTPPMEMETPPPPPPPPPPPTPTPPLPGDMLEEG